MKRPAKKPIPPTVFLVRQRYKRMNLDKGWDAKRFHRLCGRMRCLPIELAAITCMTGARLTRALELGFTANESLHFAIIEACILEVQTGVKTQPAMDLDLIVNSQPEKPEAVCQ